MFFDRGRRNKFGKQQQSPRRKPGVKPYNRNNLSRAPNPPCSISSYSKLGIQDDLGQIRFLGVEAVEHFRSAVERNSGADDRRHANLASAH